jgi:flavin reductase (DIM6/NTAB) family NADH-FMN oxidoreductase RutF
MTTFEPRALQPAEAYRLLAGCVVPRPIAWVSTVDGHGIRNLAPFSFFNLVSANPPILQFCIANREEKSGQQHTKDTLLNIRATKEFVVNVVSDENADAMNLTSAPLPYGADEFSFAGLTSVPSEAIAAPRVAEAKIQLECRLRDILVFGAPEAGTPLDGASMVLGDVVRIHIQETLLTPELRVPAERLRAVGKLEGSMYVHTGQPFTLRRSE